MKNIKLFTLFALITAALLFMFGCNKVEITNNPDDIYDEEKTDSSGLLVKEKTYPYGENDVLLLSVNNPTDKNLSITINVSYFDNENNLLKEDVRTYDQMYSGGGNNFIFNPEIGFDSYSYSISTEEYNGTIIAKDVEIKFEKLDRMIYSGSRGAKHGAVYANVPFSYKGSFMSVWIGINFIVIDNSGEVFGVFNTTGETIVYSNITNIRKAIIFESDTENVSMPKELTGNINIIYDLTRIEPNNDIQSDEVAEGLPDGFVMEEKEYKVGDEIYSLIHVKNETDKDYQLYYTMHSYEDGVLLGYDPNDITMGGTYPSGYENYLWLKKEYKLKNKGSQIKQEYIFSVANTNDENINLHIDFKNVSRQIVELPDRTEPAIVGEISPRSDVALNNVFVSGEIIGIDKNSNVCCKGSISMQIENNNTSESIILKYVDKDLMDTAAEDMDYIVAINTVIVD